MTVALPYTSVPWDVVPALGPCLSVPWAWRAAQHPLVSSRSCVLRYPLSRTPSLPLVWELLSTRLLDPKLRPCLTQGHPSGPGGVPYICTPRVSPTGSSPALPHSGPKVGVASSSNSHPAPWQPSPGQAGTSARSCDVWVLSSGLAVHLAPGV